MFVWWVDVVGIVDVDGNGEFVLCIFGGDVLLCFVYLCLIVVGWCNWWLVIVG